MLSNPIQFPSAFPKQHTPNSTMTSTANATVTANATSATTTFPNPANIFGQQEQQQEHDQEQHLVFQQQEQPFQSQSRSEPISSRSEPIASRSEPSICIPRVFKNTTRKDLFVVLEKLNIGAVDRIDMVPKTNERSETYYKVFIHFKQWHKNPMAQATRDKLLQGEEIKIVYNTPWFWKCTASRVEKPAFRDYTAPPPRIDLGGCKSLSKKDAEP